MQVSTSSRMGKEFMEKAAGRLCTKLFSLLGLLLQADGRVPVLRISHGTHHPRSEKSQVERRVLLPWNPGPYLTESGSQRGQLQNLLDLEDEVWVTDYEFYQVFGKEYDQYLSNLHAEQSRETSLCTQGSTRNCVPLKAW